MLYFPIWQKKRTAVKTSFCGSLPSPWLRWHSSGTTSHDSFRRTLFGEGFLPSVSCRTGKIAGAWVDSRLKLRLLLSPFGADSNTSLTHSLRPSRGSGQVFAAAFV